MKSRNVTSPILVAMIGGVMLLTSQIASAQPIAPSSQSQDVRYARVIINPRIMLSMRELERLQSYADRGTDALRQYLWRTRMIHNYYLFDLVNRG